MEGVPVEEEQLHITDLNTLNEYLSKQDNSENSFYFSKVPEVCKTSPCILGIDEAGRGPVLGPMVYGIAFCPAKEQIQLSGLKCVDSKALTEEARDNIFENICTSTNFLGWAVEVISPKTICNNMLSRTKYSLNQISMDSAIGLIKAAIEAGVNIEYIYVDTVGPPDKYQAYLSSIFPQPRITVAKKADSIYPIVSAASICAKVTRDHALSVWNFQEFQNEKDAIVEKFGSGYPGDPITKKFLIDHCDMVFGYPALVRFSWQTAERALASSAYHVEWEEEEEGPKPPPDNMAITSFFKMTSKSIVKPKHDFFIKRNLKNIV
ncbi:hypothetical protein AMK59_7019, partial [Oryctes borbonicus]